MDQSSSTQASSCANVDLNVAEDDAGDEESADASTQSSIQYNPVQIRTAFTSVDNVLTVLGGVRLFDAILEISEPHESKQDWYRLTAPSGVHFKSGPDGELLAGYFNAELPAFETTSKTSSRDVGLQIWPVQASFGTQTLEPKPEVPKTPSITSEEFLAFHNYVDDGRADREQLVAANIELDK